MLEYGRFKASQMWLKHIIFRETPRNFLCYDKKIENKMSKSNKKTKYKCLISFHGYMFLDCPYDPFFRVGGNV